METFYRYPGNEGVDGFQLEFEWVMHLNEMIRNEDFTLLQSEIDALSFGRIGDSRDMESYTTHYYSFG